MRRDTTAGLTLIEALTAILITVLVMGTLVTSIWKIAARAQQLTNYNQAIETVLTVNHALFAVTHSSDYVQISYTPSSNPTVIYLWMYRGGYIPQQYLNYSQPWFYNTTSVVGAQCFYVFEFVQQSNGLWTIYDGPASSPSTNVSPGTLLAHNVGVEWYLPPVPATGLAVRPSLLTWILSILGLTPPAQQNTNFVPIPDNKFINSFVIKLYANYISTTGVAGTYALTAGYHTADVL